ncbi:cobalamin-dependent protein [Candidatus Aerophobetes bacterium]|nr:cobalamin-dependent protein [Candidatus Aerophobetes bacterium]
MSKDIFQNLKKAIIEYDTERAASLAKEVMEKKIDPMKALDAMTEGIRQVGDGFGRGELWLPDLAGAADAMSSAMPIIEEEIKRSGAKRVSLGTVIVGTVFGDIHSIGKTMVCTLLTAEGFEVHDLGVNIKAEEFLEATKKYNADILAMSALMTMTASEQKKVIEYLKKEGLRNKIKIMVGGGAITEEFAKDVGADGYDPTAPGAVKLARRLTENKGRIKC